ncbi:MAG: UDP-3-O-(3-hydroxymyristoyl)glucosamine N-acyltransferase [Legionellales bacterium]|nr:UDP-3-O-(3-hydroxymyristoyl)glucosamine N-acyltransferase [Legionellales bacterium]
MKSFTLEEIAKVINAEIKGDSNKKIIGLAPLNSAGEEHLTFLDNSKYRKFLQNTKAGVVILHPKEADACPTNMLLTEQPYVAYAKVASMFAYEPRISTGIHTSSIIGDGCQIASSAKIGANVVIADNVSIGENTIIYPGVVIGDGCKIGDNCVLWPNVTIYHHVQISNHVIIHSGAIIGSDGFGMANAQGKWLKIPQLGSVMIHESVEIGANTTIDRGALGDTIIGKGVKLDNQIQIGHNVEIGEHTAIAACSGVSGSTKIGKYCMISGMVGFTGHFEIADRVVITGMTMVSKSIKTPGIYSSGTSIESHSSWRKNAVRFKQLDAMAKKIQKLEQLVNQMGEQ